MQNQEAVDMVKKVKDPTAAAKHLVTEALNRKSKDDISCIVVRFRWLVWEYMGDKSLLIGLFVYSSWCSQCQPRQASPLSLNQMI